MLMEQKPQSDYDFITNTGQAPKKSLLPSSGSKTSRIVVVAAVALFLIIAIGALFSLLGNAGKANVAALEAAALKQNELIRVADIGIKDARTQAAKDIATTTKLSMQSQQPQMLAALETAGRKLGSKELAAGQDRSVDQALTNATQNNRFDEEFLKIIAASLTEYQTIVQRAYEGVQSPRLRESLEVQFNSANVLAGQASGVPE